MSTKLRVCCQFNTLCYNYGRFMLLGCKQGGILRPNGSSWQPVVQPFGKMHCVRCRCRVSQPMGTRLTCGYLDVHQSGDGVELYSYRGQWAMASAFINNSFVQVYTFDIISNSTNQITMHGKVIGKLDNHLQIQVTYMWCRADNIIMLSSIRL